MDTFENSLECEKFHYSGWKTNKNIMDWALLFLGIWTMTTQASSSLTHVDVLVGATIKMPSPFPSHFDGTELTYTWEKSDWHSTVIFNGSHTLDSSYEVDFRPEDIIFDLRIQKTTTKDSGKFECKIINPSTHVIDFYHAVMLKVHLPRWNHQPTKKRKKDQIFSVSDHLEANYRPGSKSIELSLVGPLPPGAYVKVGKLIKGIWTSVDLKAPTTNCSGSNLRLSMRASAIRLRPCVKDGPICGDYFNILTNVTKPLRDEKDLLVEEMKSFWMWVLLSSFLCTIISSLCCCSIYKHFSLYKWGQEWKAPVQPKLRRYICQQPKLRSSYQREMTNAAKRITMRKLQEQQEGTGDKPQGVKSTWAEYNF